MVSLPGQIGKTLRVGGWVKTGREAGAGAFAFLEVNDGSTFGNLQVTMSALCRSSMPPYSSQTSRSGCDSGNVSSMQTFLGARSGEAAEWHPLGRIPGMALLWRGTGPADAGAPCGLRCW